MALIVATIDVCGVMSCNQADTFQFNAAQVDKYEMKMRKKDKKFRVKQNYI
jgi:hypothetical protein